MFLCNFKERWTRFHLDTVQMPSQALTVLEQVKSLYAPVAVSGCRQLHMELSQKIDIIEIYYFYFYIKKIMHCIVRSMNLH